ncbi:MAG: hypothetical protein MUE81_06165 [Thermoflexibacter sp.]|nr:hypothetical protein [Thermoflexibacter sp.]
MKKARLIISGLLTLALFFHSCKPNIIEIPPPDYIDIMTKAGTFKMFKAYDSGSAEDRLFRSRDTDIVIKKAPSPNEVLFEETFIQNNQRVTVTYRVQLVDPTANSNLVRLQIPQQTINNVSYEGFIFPGLESQRLQGVFEAFAAEDKKDPKTPLNNLVFAMRVNGERWLYSKK